MSSHYTPSMTFEYISPCQLAMSDISSLISIGSISTLNLPGPAISLDILTPRTSVSSEMSLNTISEIRSNGSRRDVVDLERAYEHELFHIDSLELYRCRARLPEGSVASCRYHKTCFVKAISKAFKGILKGGFCRAKTGRRAAAKCGECVKWEGSEWYDSEKGYEDECEGCEGEGSQVSTRPVSPWLELEETTWEERKEDARW
nr:hypothetical protein B0A51_05091 [Rachicladosporium sp. CCFEE 5018]